ncbi:MAG: hypothetical protein IBX45_02575 [Campylobacterales bacterium]|nr:hypothetical protein [Campylobacterales bacterium]
MKFLIKWSNILIFLSVLAGFLLLKNQVHFSTDVSAFLPEGKHKTLAKAYHSLGTAKEVLVAAEGLDAQGFTKIKALEEKMLSCGFFVLKTQELPNASLSAYADAYRYVTQKFTPQEVDVTKALEALAHEVATSSFYQPLDTKDPLGFFTSPQTTPVFSLYRGHLTLGELGFLSVFHLKPEADEAQAYRFLVQLEEEGVHLFSPLFYFVENARNIQKDVNWLLGVSVVLLCLVYVVILKNASLLVNTLVTLATCMLMALGVVSWVWTEVSVFVLAFGVAVSSIGVDYMFHHYFHHHYATKKPFNWSVLWGFLTTGSLFALFLGVEFLLVQQLSLFALIALMVAYGHFTFLYPHLGFRAPPARALVNWKTWPLRYPYVVLSSLVAFGLAWPWLSVDTNVRHLDYQNEKRLNEEAFFKANMPLGEYLPFVLEASDVDALVASSRQLKETFPEIWLPLSQLVDEASYHARTEALKPLLGLHVEVQTAALAAGFREGFFKEAYPEALLKQPYLPLSIKQLQEMGLEVLETPEGVLTKGYMPHAYRVALESRDGLYVMEATTLFLDAMGQIFRTLFWLGLAGVGVLLGMVWLACRERFVFALAYIVFPVAFIGVVFTHYAFSIMHLFMVFVVLALSVDYGIYMARAQEEVSQTRSAILFSLLSTGAGFGVLALSDVGALRDVGVVACLGVLAIGLLLLGRESDEHCCGR